jgi:hypothetical protein
MNSPERKSFQELPSGENPQFLEDGRRIYYALREKYPNQTNEDLDNVLNALCAALVILTTNNVAEESRKNFLQLIYRILDKNI